MSAASQWTITKEEDAPAESESPSSAGWQITKEEDAPQEGPTGLRARRGSGAQGMSEQESGMQSNLQDLDFALRTKPTSHASPPPSELDAIDQQIKAADADLESGRSALTLTDQASVDDFNRRVAARNALATGYEGKRQAYNAKLQAGQTANKAEFDKYNETVGKRNAASSELSKSLIHHQAMDSIGAPNIPVNEVPAPWDESPIDLLTEAPSTPKPSPPAPPHEKIQFRPAWQQALGTAVSAVTDPAPGAETGMPAIGPQVVEGAQHLGTPGQRGKGALELANAGMEAATPLMGPGILSAPLETGIALGGGYLASRKAGELADALKTSPDTKQLMETLAFWAPGVGRSIIEGLGVNSPKVKIAAGEGGTGATVMGRGGTGAGVAVTPEEIRIGGQFRGGKPRSVTIPRGPKAAPEGQQIEPPTIDAQPPGPLDEAISTMGQAQQAEIQAEMAVKGVPPPPAPDPTPPEVAHGEVSQETVQDIGKALASLPPEIRSQAILEAHGTLAAALEKQGKIIGPTGEIHIVDSPKAASKLAADVINDEISRHDEEAAKGDKQAPEKPTELSPIVKARASAQRNGGFQVVKVEDAPAEPSQFEVVKEEDAPVESANGGATVPVPVEPNGKEAANLSGSGAGKPEQLPGAVSGRTQSGDQPERPDEAAKPTFAKGDQVVLKDGTKAEITFTHPKMSIVRVRTADGRKLSVGARQVQPVQPEPVTPKDWMAPKAIAEVPSALSAPVTKSEQLAKTPPVNVPEVPKAETKFKFGSTQANIPADSEAHKGLETARQRIAPADLAGKGTDVGGNHLTVRYGIKGEDHEGIKKYLSSLEPFDATLGKTAKFPPSEHSDGAAVIHAPIEAPELHKINAELEKHGEFTEPSFKYSPHSTVAYVKNEKADRYVGMSATEGKKFRVNSIAITDRNGGQHEVKLEGKPAVEQKLEPEKPLAPEPEKQAETPAVVEGDRKAIAESELQDLKRQSATLSEQINKQGWIHTPPGQLRKANEIRQKIRQREDEIARLNGEPTHDEKRDIRQKAVEKTFGDRPAKAMTYGQPEQSQHWQVLEPDYVEKRFGQKVQQYERAIPEKRAEVEKLKAGTAKHATEKSTLHFWEQQRDRYKEHDPRLAQSFKTEYNGLVKKAVSQGRPVPTEVIQQKSEFILAKGARERYEKGRHTSFANRSAAIDDTMQKDEGFKVKRQDGKPIPEEQAKEISDGVNDVVEVLGPALRDMMRGTDLTIAHTNGKHPFLSDAGGEYHPVERSISAGVKDFLGRPIQALAHELGHWMDFEAGRALNVNAYMASKSGARKETKYVSEADGRSALYDRARSTMTDTREVAKMLKMTKTSDLPEAERAEVERVKVELGHYWRDPRELWARMFEQYIAEKLGRKSMATESIERYYKAPAWWSKEAWDKLKPEFEKELAKRMDALRERYAPTEPAAVTPSEAPPAEEKPGILSELIHGETGSFEPGKLGAPAKAIADFLHSEIEENARARDLQGGLYDLESQYQGDVLRAVHTVEAVNKELGKQAPKDYEAIYHHLENPEGVPLNAQQDKLLDETILPLMDESNRIYEKLSGGGIPAENYVHRVVKDKGGFFDKILAGKKVTGRGNLLQKSGPQLKHRTMMALEEVQKPPVFPSTKQPGPAKRLVVAVKGGKVTSFSGGAPTDLGGLRSGLTTKQGQLHEEVARINREIKKLKDERRILLETPSRIAVTFSRRKNISEEIDKLERERESLVDNVDDAQLDDQLFIDNKGREWKFTQATTKEIEANTDLKYHHNALASTLVSYLQLRKAERGFDFVESFKSNPDFQKIAFKQGEGNAPDGWKPTDLPQLRGYYFEPHVSEVLDWYAQRLKGSTPNIFDSIGQFLRTSIFFNPLIHTPNIAVHFAVEKGPSGYLPTKWANSYRAGVKAINAVTKQNQDFLDALDAGAPMQSQREDTAKITQLFFDQLSPALENSEPWALKLAKAIGMSPVNLVKAIYAFSGKATWVTNDIAFLQAAYEKVGAGMSLKEALNQTAKHIPDYRLPVRIFNSTAIAKLMSNPSLTMFGGYHYGALKSYAEMAKSAVGANQPPPGHSKAGEAFHGWELLVGIGLLTFGLYPLIDRLLRKATGDDNAMMRRAGAATLPYNIAQLLKHEKSPTEVLESVATPAAHTKTALELAVNHDLRTGRQIYDPLADWRTQGQQIGRRLAEAVSPVGQGVRMYDDEGARKRFVYGLGGISFPLHGAEKIASIIAQGKLPTKAQDPDGYEDYLVRRNALDALRKGDDGPLENAIGEHKINREQAHKLKERAKLTPLQDKVHSFSYPEAMRVYDAATPEQKQELEHIIRTKRRNLLKKGKSTEQVQ